MGQDRFFKKILIIGTTGVTIALLVVFATIYSNKDVLSPKSPKIREISINKAVVKAEVVDTELLRIQGLSGRKNLNDGNGMFFVFADENYHGIWMKEMNFPIDIIWFDEKLKVVGIKENALPESYPEIFKPSSPAFYVLEVPANFVKKHKIEIGMVAEIVSHLVEKN